MTTVIEREGFYPYSYKDYWPPPIEDTEVRQSGYLGGTLIFLDRPQVPQFAYTWNTLGLFIHYEEDLTGVERWADYKIREIGDSNVGTHTLRQTGITIAAITLDGDAKHVTNLERDILVSAALHHDFGELTTTDLSYEVKRVDAATKRESDIAEAQATLAMIDAAMTAETKQTSLQRLYDTLTDVVSPEEILSGMPKDRLANQMKEIYLRVTTSLDEPDITELLGSTTHFDESINWDTLNKLFSLYERYGFLITAFQQWPYSSNDIPEIPQADLDMLRSMNRAELVAADEQGIEVPPSVRQAISTKNVLLNQWNKIVAADKEGIPSTRVFFNNNITKFVVPQAIDTMRLDIDPGFILEN